MTLFGGLAPRSFQSIGRSRGDMNCIYGIILQSVPQLAQNDVKSLFY